VRSRGLSVRHLVEKRQTLEELFLETVGDDDAEPRRPRRDAERDVRQSVTRRREEVRRRRLDDDNDEPR